jgi:hypothetical protein
MSSQPIEVHKRINQTIAKFLSHEDPLDYTGNITLAWQSLERLQEFGYGFTLNSLGRNNLKVRIVKWAGNGYSVTSTGEYIVSVMDSPPPFAICRAVVETIRYDNIAF